MSLEAPEVISWEDLALEFFARWGTSLDECCAAFEEVLAPECVWDQRPIPRMHGPRAAVRFLRLTGFVVRLETIEVEILRVASSGNVVHVERIDRLRRADGSVIAAAPVVGVLTFSGDRVVHWREYFDSAGFVAQTLASSARYAVRKALPGTGRPARWRTGSA